MAKAPHKPSRAWFIFVGFLGLSSCGQDILGPLNNRIFVLRTVDGMRLPATVTGEFGGLAWIVTADTIWFESGSEWRRHSVQHREVGIGGDPLDREHSGDVIFDGQILILSFNCPNGDCLTPDRALGNTSGLEMEQTFLHDGKRLVFEPIQAPLRP